MKDCENVNFTEILNKNSNVVLIVFLRFIPIPEGVKNVILKSLISSLRKYTGKILDYVYIQNNGILEKGEKPTFILLFNECLYPLKHTIEAVFEDYDVEAYSYMDSFEKIVIKAEEIIKSNKECGFYKEIVKLDVLDIEESNILKCFREKSQEFEVLNDFEDFSRK